jgi:uncharacterized protein (TIGR03435 family)
MKARALHKTTSGNRNGRAAAFLLAAEVLLVFSPGMAAQSAAPAQTQSNPNSGWETAAGGHMEFDVISIHPEKDPDADSSQNVPYGPEDTYTDTGGIFRTTNWPVVRLISFAFKGNTAQGNALRASLPDWALNEGFNIEARSDNPHPTKDQMRLMVRAMLIERFGLKAHYETRQVSVYAVELIKPGVPGPGLRPHPNGNSCSGEAAAIAARPPANAETDVQPAPAGPSSGPAPRTYPTLPGGFPIRCGTFVNMPPSQPYMRHEGGRNLTMAQVVSTFSGMGNLGRPAVDRTGLTGTYDWVMEFIDERDGHVVPPDADGLNFAQALEKQVGLKLVSTKAPYQFLIVDHVERPSEN